MSLEPVNLTDQHIDSALVRLCSKGPSFVPTPTNIDWNDLQKNWLYFKRKVRWKSFYQGHNKTPRQSEVNPVAAPHVKSTKEPPPSTIPAIEVFLSSVEKDLFDVSKVRKVADNLTFGERTALKKFRGASGCQRDVVVRIQDKSNNFVFLDKNIDAIKVKEQMDRGSFKELDHDISDETCSEILNWVETWKPLGLSDNWIKFICDFGKPRPGVNYPLIKTHKTNNPARVITSDCGTPTENLSLFVEKYCKVVIESIPCRVRDTSHMLDIIDELNVKGIQEDDLLVSFDITNMFPSIDNQVGIERVRCKLSEQANNFDIPVDCIVDALKICLKRNCSTYDGQFWLQENGTAMGPKNASSYADIVAEEVDKQVVESQNIYSELKCWFRFRDDTFVLWRGSVERLQAFFQRLNTFDPNLQFTMEIGGSSLHFLDLMITITGNKLKTSIYSKPTDAHLYLNAKSSHPKSQILGIARGVALRLRRICSDYDDFCDKSKEYCEYLIGCGHNREHVLKAFNEIGNMTRKDARKRKQKKEGNYCVFISKFNPRVPNIHKIFQKYRSVIDSDERAKQILPEETLRVAYKRDKNLKELLAPSNPYKGGEKVISGSGCSACTASRCDCCHNFLLVGSSFCSTATGRTYTIRMPLTCTSQNVVYLAHCLTCNLQGVGSTINFKSRLANYKSHIKKKKRTCNIVNHFIDCHGGDHGSLKFMIIDQHHDNVRSRENFWIGTLLTNLNGLNASHDFVQQ